jgi:HSP20 family protein
MAKKEKAEKAVEPAQTSRWPSLWSRDLDEFFDRTMRPWPFSIRPRFGRAGRWMPEIDVFEKDGNLVVRADVPGAKREDIEVSLEGDLLTISGHREEEKEVKEEDFYSSERSVGRFSRTVRIPEGVKPASVSAVFEDGVLTVTVPQPKETKSTAKKITVK